MPNLSKSLKHAAAANRGNYWLPLQALDDDEDEMEEISTPAEKPPKVTIPPITILGKSPDFVLSLLDEAGMKDFLIKKISIGVKIILNSLGDYTYTISMLKNSNIQFFTHDLPTARSFKVVLRGLEGKSASEVQNALTSLNLKCKEVKIVRRTFEQYTDTLYILFFENGSVRLSDLRKDVKSLFRTIVYWEFQRKLKGKITQCRNCQMFCHGEKGCNIKTKCANAKVAANSTSRNSQQPQYYQNTLFSEEEIFQITIDLILSLSNCSSKEQQFQTNTRLAIKHLYSK